jgi:hypothetical protein
MSRKGSEFLPVEPVYETFEPKERLLYSPGQFAWAYSVYPYDPPLALDLVEGSYDPKRDQASFNIVRRRLSEKPPEHLPVKSLNLQTDEHLFVLKGKRRQVVILGKVDVEWLDAPQKLLLCVPVFTFKDRHTIEAVIRIQAFQFPNLFYLPLDANVGKEESAARLELSQCVQKGWLQPVNAPGPKPFRLTRPAYQLLCHQFGKFINSGATDEGIDKDLQAYRQLLFEAYSI